MTQPLSNESIHAVDPVQLTPAMRQYQQYKQQYPDAILFFRMGDFYELFYEDARTAARVLGVALTSRSKGENAVPMAGVPYHAVDSYLHRMISAGYKVAICEQMEDPKLAKGVIKREVTRLVTPGTLTEENMLDGRQENFLAALVVGDAKTRAGGAPGGGGGAPSSPHAALAWCELSTGKFLTMHASLTACLEELARIGPRELLFVEPGDHRPPEWAAHLQQTAGVTLTGRPAWQLDTHHATQVLRSHYGVATFEGFGYATEKDPALCAAGGIVAYLHETQKAAIEHLQPPRSFQRQDFLVIDPVSLRALEVHRTLRGGNQDGSLVGSLDQTQTPMGSRLLRNWLCYPLREVAAINARLDAVERLMQADRALGQIRQALGDCSDIERITARLCCRRGSPRDLVALSRSLAALCGIGTILAENAAGSDGSDDADALAPAATPAPWAELLGLLPAAAEMAGLIRGAIADDPPSHLRDGHCIRDGYHADLDRLRALSKDSRAWLAQYQAKLASESGIASLKVGYNKVFGFYIEITNAHAAKIPANFNRKQTIKNAERYTTPELKQYESDILTAQERSIALEQDLFEQLRATLAQRVTQLQGLAHAAATLDVVCGLAHLARTRQYSRPVLLAGGGAQVLHIVDGRHPVVEQTLGEKFVPNDTLFGVGTAPGEVLPGLQSPAAASPLGLAVPEMPHAGGPGASTLHLITGPNMAGKSTYIRQVALLTLMAQAGSFVPAKRCTLSVVDRIFTRIGASDDLAGGQSTFMVEMTETANILHHATPESLIILDEIGRGTSTLDGLALAWAIAEFLADTTKARTLFATHYHELTELADTNPAVANYNVLVREWEDQVIFMHRIVPGQADRSYGVHVARLAGVPRSVITRARQLMNQLSVHVGRTGRVKAAATEVTPQINMFDTLQQQTLSQLRALDMNRMSPMQAWEALRSLQALLEQAKG
jgi:DNA mismatch repair protein MutS